MGYFGPKWVLLDPPKSLDWGPKMGLQRPGLEDYGPCLETTSRPHMCCGWDCIQCMHLGTATMNTTYAVVMRYVHNQV